MASNRHSGSDVGSLFELEFVGVEDDGERSVVHKLDLHIGTKTARLDTSHVGTDEVDEVFIELGGLRRWRGLDKGGAAALPAIGEQRELRDHQNLAVHIGSERFVFPPRHR